MRVERIKEGIKLVYGTNNGKFPYCNVLVVGRVVIDAGAGIEIMEKIAREVDYLLLSHTHPDHASGAWIFNSKDKKVITPMEVPTDLDSLAVRFVTEKFAEIWKIFARSIGMKSFKADNLADFVNKKELETIEAIPLPGHCMDHHVYLIDKILYAADVDLTNFGPFYGNPESDPREFKKRIEGLLNLDFEILISSHSSPVYGRENIESRINEYLEFFDRRDEAIIEILRKPRTIDEIVRISPIYGKKPYEMIDFFERNMIEKHLEKLIKEGRVKKLGKRYVSKI